MKYLQSLKYIFLSICPRKNVSAVQRTLVYCYDNSCPLICRYICVYVRVLFHIGVASETHIQQTGLATSRMVAEYAVVHVKGA